MSEGSAQTRLGSEEDGGVRFWICAAAGLGIVGFGIVGLVNARHVGSIASWVAYLVGGLLVHDVLLAPLVVAISVVCVYVVPTRLRPAAQATFIVAGTVALVAIPAVGGWGRKPGNPSLLPRDYALGLAIALGVVLAAGAVGALRTARRPPPPRPPEGPRGW